MYGLTSQTRRAAVSVTANIAEVDLPLLTAHALDFLSAARYEPRNETVQELKRVLNGFLQAVRRTQ